MLLLCMRTCVDCSIYGRSYSFMLLYKTVALEDTKVSIFHHKCYIVDSYLHIFYVVDEFSFTTFNLKWYMIDVLLKSDFIFQCIGWNGLVASLFCWSIMIYWLIFRILSSQAHLIALNKLVVTLLLDASLPSFT